MRVYIPWRDSGCRWRSRAFSYVVDWWADRGHDVIQVDAGGDRFNRAAARNKAVDMAGRGVICIADADMFCESLDVDYRGGLHLPYTRYNALDQTSTFLRYHGRNEYGLEHSNDSESVGGIMIVDCDEWRAVGGMCEGFVGWGFEDTDLANRMALYRTEQDAYHLWHPTECYPDSDEYKANKNLYLRRYGEV